MQPVHLFTRHSSHPKRRPARRRRQKKRQYPMSPFTNHQVFYTLRTRLAFLSETGVTMACAFVFELETAAS